MIARSSLQRQLPEVLVCAIMMVLFASSALGQGITVNTVVTPVNILSVSDVDIVHSSTSQWLFTVDLNTGGRSMVLTAEIDLYIDLASGESFHPALKLFTKRFVVNGSRSFTNLDIGTGKTIQDSAGLSYWDHAAENRIKDIALPTGQLPAGKYTIYITVKDVTTGTSSSVGKSSAVIVLTNPSNVELLFPTEGDQHVSPLPLFQWVFDGTTSKLWVFEKLPTQATLDEATQGTPIFTIQTASNSYPYQPAGSRPLQAGKTYVWYVEGRVNGLGGKAYVLKSPLRSFTIEPGVSGYSSLLEELEHSLDPKYKSVFDQIRSDGLLIYGSPRTNGAILPANELLRILDYFRKHPDAVQSVTME
jgi:hypothetical protein